MKITPISNEPSVAVAVVADEENVIATKNDFDTASRVDDEDVDASLHSSSSSSRWTKCLIVGVIALIAVVAVSVALPLVNTREAEDAALQITFGMMNQSSNNETRFYKSITSNGRHGICSIDEQGSSITYTPNEGFFGIDTCTYTVIVCTDADFCDSTEETITVVVEDPDAPVTSPDAMVLVGRGVTDSTTSTARLMSSTITSTSSTTPAVTTIAPDEEVGASSAAATTTSVPTTADNLCSECSITNGTSNFCGLLGVYPFMDACESQTECKEQGLGCRVCTTVEGFDGEVGGGAYVCVEEEGGDKTVDVTTTTTTTTTATAATTTTAITESPCSECSMTNVTSNFCGQLGIHTFMDACESQTECKERGLGCRVCTTVEGFDGDDVGGGAYVCVEEEGAPKASDETTTTTTALPTTISSTSTTTAEALKGGIESLIGKKWKAVQIRWLVDSSSGELKEATEEDKNPITLLFKSDTRASGTCGNNHCSSGVSVRADQLKFGKFRRTRMRASEQETNYVHLLEENTFFYEVLSEDGNDLPELHLYEIIIDEDDVKKRGRLMATYVQLSEEDEEEV
eukprot:scaffold23551_cov78-Skeletonema_dohrnii-CCMP3373.AAC.1